MGEIHMQNFEFWLAVDNEGNAAVSMDGPAEARTAVLDDFESEAIRVAKIAVAMELPEVPEISVEVPSHAADESVEAEATEETKHEHDKALEAAE
jgi:hypothetical protein